MRQALYKGSHHSVAYSLNNVGVAYYILGDIKKGLEYGERALKMNQALYKGNHPELAMTFSNIGLMYKELGDTGKYNLYKRQACSREGFIKNRGSVTGKITAVKEKLQKKILNKIQELSSEGTWSYKYITGIYDWGIKGYLDKKYLNKQLGEFASSENLDIALSLCFEAINIEIANSKEPDYTCAIEFASAYPDLVSATIIEHPEYFILDDIAKSCLDEEAYHMLTEPTAAAEDKVDNEKEEGKSKDLIGNNKDI